MNHKTLNEFCAKALEKAGLSKENANIAADILVECDIRGVYSHGVVALPYYIKQMKLGGINVQAEPAIEKEGLSYTLLNGNGGMGQLNAYKATKIAIEKAKKSGVAISTVKNSNHFGAGATYALMAAREGMIGQAISNAPPTMSVTGGKGRNIGNNPFSLASPAGKHSPVVLDMAMSVVAAGKIANAAVAGESIPKGWMLDKDGHDTSDPKAFQEGGALLPFGGYKGYGLAAFVEILAGIMPGAGITHQVTSWKRKPDAPTQTGHFIQVINVDAFMPIAEFKSRIDEFINEIHNYPRVDGCEKIFVPGEIENITAEKALQEGVYLAEGTAKGLIELAKETGLDYSFLS